MATAQPSISVLVHFFDEWSDFRVQEYNSLLETLGVSTSFLLGEGGPPASFVCTTLPSEEVAVELCQRAVLVRGIYELWGQGPTFGDLVEDVRRCHVPPGESRLVSPWLSVDKSWSLSISSHCKTLTASHKDRLRLHFRCLDFQGTVALDNPDLHVGVMLDYSGRPGHNNAQRLSSPDSEEELPTVPCYCGRLLARGGMRDELRKYDLKKRLYLGPTTLDHALALVMANISGVKRGSFALDPFVGTASILIALSHFGAHCTGMDIDVRVLKGAMYAGSTRPADAQAAAAAAAAAAATAADSETLQTAATTVKRDIFETFRSYELSAPELLRMDIHLLDRHFCESLAEAFDVIVTDPPYGIRAGGRKSGKTNGCSYKIPAEGREDHIPSTQNYPVEEVMLDLLHAAARMLRKGGSLCYLIPTSFDFDVSDLPKHPCLTLKRLCHQGLSTRHGRHLVLMHKTSDYTAEVKTVFDKYRANILAYGESKESQDAPDGFCKLLGKLELALSSGGYENEKVIKQASKGAIRRKESARARSLASRPPLTEQEN